MRTLALLLALASAPVSAGLLGYSAQDTANLLRTYRGKSIDAVVAAIGYPDRQDAVMDRVVYYWGADHEDGPVCTVKVVTGADRSVIESRVYGNIQGCSPLAKRLKATAAPGTDKSS